MSNNIQIPKLELGGKPFSDLLSLVMSWPVLSENSGEKPSETNQESGSSESSSASAKNEDGKLIYERSLLDRIGLEVTGKTEDGKVKAFSLAHRFTKTFKDVAKISYEELLLTCGTKFRDQVSDGSYDEDDEKIPMKEIRQAIALVAGYRCLKNKPDIGIGVWQGRSTDNEPVNTCILVGQNDAIELSENGSMKRITTPRCGGHVLDFKGTGDNWFDPDHLEELVKKCDRTFAIETRNALVQLFQRWEWTNGDVVPVVAAGLVFASWVQTFWEWRPLVSVVGASNTGKTTFLNCLKGIFGSLQIKAGDATMAGLRNHLGNTAKIPMLDEFESREQRNSFLAALRSSSRGDEIIRGTTDQTGTSFTLQHIVWLAAIESGLDKAADKNRFITLELDRPQESKQGKLVVPSNLELRELGQRVLVVALKHVHEAKKLAVKIKDTKVPGADPRMIESFAVPAAIMSIIEGYDESGARDILKEMLKKMRLTEIEQARDEASLVETILAETVRVRNENMSVARLVSIVLQQLNGHADAKEELNTYGLDVAELGEHKDAKNDPRQPVLVIAYHMVRSKLLKSTSWKFQSIEQILKRIDGATSGIRKRVGSQRPWTVCIPIEYLRRENLLVIDSLEPDVNF